MELRKPANDRLLVKEVSGELKTNSGLFVAEAFESSTKKTQILATGKTKETYTIGHYAWIQQTAGIPLSTGELIISEGHILFTTEE